ncbi:hypothetical protein F1643_20970 [Azospirillum sp. INR13]|uniref:hypothetical protein n=1 Tax=Azospirillum sp. INR13 TaxID=2596919 RepID=UPI0018922CF4|nr:hypothetical protein [Azospirillum sp. INR13]MBF5096472.1 hypothetical protein [Azospirillum sp. INR13]
MREAASTGQPKFRPTQSQIAAMRMAAKRDWPAGEPRIDWINKATARVLLREGVIVERPHSAAGGRGNIIDLTPVGEALLVSI